MDDSERKRLTPHSDTAAHADRPSMWVLVLAIIGRILQAIFSLQMIGCLFFVWIIVNEAGCNSKPGRWVPYTGWQLIGKWQVQLLSFPVLGVILFVTAIVGIVKIRRKMPRGFPFFCAVVKLLVANGLCVAGIGTAFAVGFFSETRDGPGQNLAFSGAIGIGGLGLVGVIYHGLSRLLSKRAPPRADLSPQRCLRFIGLFDYVVAIILIISVMIILAFLAVGKIQGNDTAGAVYGCLMLGLSACSLFLLGRGIRCGEGWAAVAHVVGAALVCAMNVLIMIVSLPQVIELHWAVLVWSIFPLFSGVVFYVLLIRARRDINWPIRFARCGVCGRRGIWQANACGECGNSLKPLPDSPQQEYCIYCRKSVPASVLRCRSCRKAVPGQGEGAYNI